jgi:glucose dehydrogenase
MSQLNVMTKLVVVILLGVGSVLIVGGAQLALLGGSLYYLASGVALVISSVWIWQRCSWRLSVGSN